MANQFGYIEIANTGATRFTNANDNDMVVYTDAATQRIHIGTRQNAPSAMTITSNNIILNNDIAMVGNLQLNGIRIAKSTGGTAPNITQTGTVANVQGYTFDTNSIKLTLSNNQTQFLFGNSNNSNVATLSQVGDLVIPGNISAANLGIFRNRIINGDMRIDQRNNGAALTTVTGTTHYWAVDRTPFEWRDCGTFTIQQISTDAPPGFTHSLRATLTATRVPAAGDYAMISHRIEGINIADFCHGTAASVPMRLSFWVKSSVAGTYAVAIDNNHNGNRNYVTTFNIPTANTWTRIVVSFPPITSGTWNTNTDVGLRVMIALAAGSGLSATANTWLETNNKFMTTGCIQFTQQAVNSTFLLTGLQLEKGTQDTPFEFRPIASELMLCQRYFERLRFTGQAPGGGAATNIFVWNSSGGIDMPFQFKVEKRIVPTIINNNAIITQDLSKVVISSTGNATTSTGRIGISFTGATAFIITGSWYAHWYGWNSGGSVDANAEFPP